MTGNPTDSDLPRLLGGQLSRGEVLLFTGAGFSHDAKAADGQGIPSVWDLKQLLWPIAFPGAAFEDDSTLGDIFDCALRQSPNRLERILRSALTVDASSLPSVYSTWFSMPWRRIYTLNIDDLDLAVQRKFELPVRIVSVSALKDPVPARDSNLSSIHLNGALSDLPNVTFSARQYGDRIPGRDPWYASLVTELIGSPVVFVGTGLDESPLWQHMALRGDRAQLDRELRPRSYLVTPSVPHARKALLRNLNIDHIPMTTSEFATEILEHLSAEAAIGHDRLGERRTRPADRSSLHRVAELRLEDTTLSLADYLMGREPVWKDLISGFAVVREFEAALVTGGALVEPRVSLITGTVASGKTTTLMRCCLELQAQGRDVWWLDFEVDQSLARIRQEIRRTNPEVLAIDDIDDLGANAGSFIRELLEELPTMIMVVTSRSTRAERIGLVRDVSLVNSHSIVVPPLGDNDIDLLLAALDRANRLGRLKGKPFAEQRVAFREHANRQLLVAMIEATSGRRFDDKVDDECRQLEDNQAFLYLICALATRFKWWLPSDEILLAAGGVPANRLRDFDALVRQHLVVERRKGEYIVRHRVIAERVCNFYRRERRLAPAVEGLLFALATKMRPTTSRRARESRLLVQLLNHRFMIEELGDLSAARRVYDVVENVLSNDHQYWLQRGSLEVEVGDLELAENYLNQARGIAPDDGWVQTEWAYMSLKRAAEDAVNGRSTWRERAEEAVAELKDAIVHRGKADPYPFHILGSQGLRFIRRAPMTNREKEVFLRDIVSSVSEGYRLHPGADDLKQLLRDLEREYLMLSVEKRNPVPDLGTEKQDDAG